MNKEKSNITNNQNYQEKSIRSALARRMQTVIAITHNGAFHGDEVFCIALMLELGLITRESQVYRAADMPDISVVQAGTYFIDIGGAYGKEIIEHRCSVYDHHGFKKYRDPINKKGRYASFGLLWSFFGTRLLSRRGAQRFDDIFASKIDAHDNGEKPFAICHLISGMNPLYGSFESEDGQFWKAVRMAREILKREIAQIKVWEAMSKKVPEIIAGNLNEEGNKINEYIVLKEHMPVLSILSSHRKAPSFVIYPGKRKCWNVHAIGSGNIKLPKEWWGAVDANLPEGCIFCHENGFLLAAETKAAAIAAVEIAVQKHKEEFVELEEGDIKEIQLIDSILNESDFDIDEVFVEEAVL